MSVSEIENHLKSYKIGWAILAIPSRFSNTSNNFLSIRLTWHIHCTITDVLHQKKNLDGLDMLTEWIKKPVNNSSFIEVAQQRGKGTQVKHRHNWLMMI